MSGLIAVLLLVSVPAFAETAEQAFLDGRFAQAASMAEAEGGADNYARAARCILAGEVVNGTLDPRRLDAAERLARQALAVEAGHVEGRLQLAIVLSMKARLMSTRDVLDAGYGRLGRELAESVIMDDPGNAYAHGFLAVWNVEVVRKGGMIGSAWFGASMREAEIHYEAALESGRGDASLNWQYARALAANDARKYRDEIYQSLRRALEATPDSALDRTMQARAREFWGFMADHSSHEIEAQAQSLL